MVAFGLIIWAGLGWATLASSGDLAEAAAEVNGETITFRELVEPLVAVHGEAELTRLTHEALIREACRLGGIDVSKPEVDAEILSDIKRQAGDLERFRKVLARRGLSLGLYAEEVRLRLLREKIADRLVEVTPTDIQEAFQRRYGERLRLRWILTASEKRCQRAWERIKQQELTFQEAAAEYSDDPTTRSLGGELKQLIGHGMFPPEVDQILFGLEPGQISTIVQLEQGHAFFQCVERVPAEEVQLDDVRAELEQVVRQQKRREAIRKLHTELIKNIHVERFPLEDKPDAGSDPGPRRVLAVVGQQRITWEDLAVELIRRYGPARLERLIDLMLLNQACRRAGIVITAEQVAERLQERLRQKNMTLDQIRDYLRQTGQTFEDFNMDGWAAMAWEKLLEGRVSVTEKDVRDAFTFAHGERCKLRWILLTNVRVAQQVAAELQKNPQLFPELARRYSAHQATGAKGGLFPTLVGRGAFTQPELETAIFQLKPGQMTPVLQVEQGWAVFQCLEKIPADEGVKFEDKREELTRRLIQEKTRVVREQQMDEWRRQAKITRRLPPLPDYDLPVGEEKKGPATQGG